MLQRGFQSRQKRNKLIIHQMNPTIQQTKLTPTTISSISTISIIGASVIQLCSDNTSRQYLEIQNLGVSALWIGTSSTMSWGATGTNIGTIGINSSKSFPSFSGSLWGQYGASTAVGHIVKVYEY